MNIERILKALSEIMSETVGMKVEYKVVQDEERSLRQSA